ncbi:Signal transduction histidine kinase [Candidatus Terasakiella magnetica]|nr:Signal transduction histidine kinase [Candidatus Terasakiella magnetica]
MSFNLFDAEEKTLEQAEILRAGLTDQPESIRTGINDLVDAFSRSVREQRRLVRVSDRLQAQLATVNQELARRRAEAETALGDLQAAQDSLIQSEKLASLGALVGGIAHEINTPVGIALSCASHLADSTAGLRKLFEADNIGIEDFERYLATATDTTTLILSNCERAAALIRSFKQVAVDRASSERRRFDLGDYVRETLASLGPHLRQAGHTVKVECPAGLILDSYPGALSQVLSNFVMNSLIHGFDSGQTGTLSILIDQPTPQWVRLIYADNGKGVPESDLSRIFDPFFTTRRGSGGSGLGLHIVYNLVTGPLGGSVSVEKAANGRGVAFTVTLPLSSEI